MPAFCLGFLVVVCGALCVPGALGTSATCWVQMEPRPLEVVDENGVVCVTPADVVLNYCWGFCNNDDAEYIGDIMSNGEQIKAEQSSCRCCTEETSHYEDVTFLCGENPTVFQVKQIDDCICDTCGGEEIPEPTISGEELSQLTGSNIGLFGSVTNDANEAANEAAQDFFGQYFAQFG